MKWFIIFLLVIIMAGCASRTTPQYVASPSSASQQKLTESYRIGAFDLLDIQVFGVEELSRKVRVNTRGEISLPLVGLIRAEGLTGDQLEKRIASRLEADYLQNPQVSVFIEEYTSQRVTVEGEVKKPGVFPLTGRTTLMQSIALAEGLSAMADSDDVTIFRQAPGQEDQRIAYPYDLSAIRDGKMPDPVVQGDDVVVVGKSTVRSTVKTVTDTVRGFILPFPIFR